MHIINVLIIAMLLFTTSTQVASYVYMALSSEQNGLCKGQDGKLHTIGSTWYYKKKCERAMCVTYNSKLYEDVMGCGSVGAAGNCRVVAKKTGIYPYCCQTIVCE